MACRSAFDALLAAVGDRPGRGPGHRVGRPVIFSGDLNDEPVAAMKELIEMGMEDGMRQAMGQINVVLAEAG